MKKMIFCFIHHEFQLGQLIVEMTQNTLYLSPSLSFKPENIILLSVFISMTSDKNDAIYIDNDRGHQNWRAEKKESSYRLWQPYKTRIAAEEKERYQEELSQTAKCDPNRCQVEKDFVEIVTLAVAVLMGEFYVKADVN